MALVLKLKYTEYLRGRGDRLAKVTFRGVCHYSKIIENADDTAVFDETFEWPVARPIESEEQIEIQIYQYNKYLSNKLIGTLRMVLQQLVEVGELQVSDCLLDDNNVVMKTCVTFTLKYNAPDGSVGAWQRDQGFDMRDDQYHGQMDDEESHLLVPDRGSESDSLSSSPSKSFRSSRLSMASRGSAMLKSPTKATVRSLKSVAKLMKLGKQRPPPDDEPLLHGTTENVAREQECVDERLLIVPDPRPDEDNLSDSQTSGTAITGPVLQKKARTMPYSEQASLKAQDFQVSVTIIEARQLAGLNMDPVVCVQVGDQKKYTSVKESTNCPYWNEYFVFDFHMAPAMLFDKIITLTVLHSRNLLRSGTVVGTFKFDVGTVYMAPDHQFYHKWAMLTDSEDMNSGPKGFLKCDIAVVGKGDNIKAPPKTDKEEDDIEGNLLLPEGVPAERQKAKFIVKIYKAEGLPKMTTGLMTNIKKAFTGEAKDLVDPYVMVSFAGHRERTSVKKGSYEPVWNEQIVFTEMFPPLCRRIKVQLRDSDSVNDDIIGTHFIDLAKISNEGEKGFLPTFGPSWINLYGSTRNYSIMEEHSHLNEGLGEGVSYRGRLLVALKTEILANDDCGPSMVEVEATLPVSETAAGRPDHFFMFGTILEANMIDRKLSDKPIKFELSIGNYGNTMDGRNESAHKQDDSEDEEDQSADDDNSSKAESGEPEWHSTTDPMKPQTTDRFYYFLPYYEEKPCVWVKGIFEDHRKRMYNANMIEKIAEKLEDGLADVHEMLRQEKPYPERRLRGVLEELATGCSRYVTLAQGKGGGPSAGRNKLDKERLRLCQREIDQIGTMARTLKATVSKNKLKDKIKATSNLQNKLRNLAHEPQHALPDVFIWLISNNKRIAYHRIPAKDIIFSIVDEERGKECGRVQTLFLKLPGKKGTGPTGWAVQAKLQMYLWLGLAKHKKELLKGLPSGYEDTPLVRRACRIVGSPPPSIKYIEKQTFQLRAHMYQARSLIGSDASGLSDPFARVVFGDQSQCTQVIDETLSPTWDEMLIFNEVTIYGTIDEIKETPPTIVVEIFDQDRVGKAEFIGRALAKPIVKKSDEKYERPTFPPQLEWSDICRGPDRAGELLAAFELLQYPFDENELKRALVTPPQARKRLRLRDLLSKPGDPVGQDLPPLELPEAHDQDRGPIMPVPKGIRPTLSKHRIEVLFWGMRELKKIHFTSVDKPRIDVECAGHVLSSSVIVNSKKNPNFTIPVKFFDVELPDNELYCPPITIRCVDCRNFGRFVLVGTHVINNIHKFMYVPTTKTAKEAWRKFLGAGDKRKEQTSSNQLALPGQATTPRPSPQLSRRADDIAINIDGEKQPLISKSSEQLITIDTGTDKDKEQNKVDVKRKRKKDALDADDLVDDMDLDCLDWWSKYHASMETMIKAGVDVQHEELQEKQQGQVAPADPLDVDNQQISDNLSNASKQPSTPYGAIPNGTAPGEDPEFDPKEAKKSEKELKKMEEKQESEKRLTFRGAAKSVSLASKLSPKTQRKKEKTNANTAQLKVYPNELEAQPEFNGFREWLHTFELYRGKKTGEAEDDDSRVVGKFKGSLKIYKIPLPPDIEDTTITGGDPSYGLFQGLPSNDPIHVLVRVYIVKANDLHPADINGKADPYIVLRLGKTTINDKDNYISKQLNPVFGKCFEVEATFPMDSLLTIQIYDWDLVGSDDLIGETRIDLENRFYSRHRATVGIAEKYEICGYNAWRDPMKPTQILAKLCKDNKIDGPHFNPGKIRVANRIFTGPIEDSSDENARRIAEENLALAVLKHWEEIPKVGCKLVPEHVETRPLYNADKPGIEQGKLEMWVDMFPMDMPPPGPQVDISPRKPTSYELRVIIWNTDDVVLEDDAFFTGEKMSDIYVKGWIKGPDDMQSTDIHYRSLTGEGNFNWRFIFPFDYLVAEEKIVISRKENLFSWDQTETKIPARLNLQVWDADHFSADDFLGALTLDLNQFPRGAKTSKQCTLGMLKQDGSVPQMSLFKHKRVKGWWPFHVKNEGEDEMELTGKVEAELHLLTAEEAEKHPAGMARNEPDPLEKPNRPDTSFLFFMNPLKSLRYILWQQYRWVFLKAILFMLLILLLGLFLYNMPGYMVKKLLGA